MIFEPQTISTEKRIMRRVYFIWFFRLFLKAPAVKLIILLAAFLSLSQAVSFQAVINNSSLAPSWSGYYGFWLGAFTHTHTLVQVGLVFSLLIGLWLLTDSRKLFRLRRRGRLELSF